ncbi:MAG: hypothetical protein ACOC5B_03660, partial [Myxococcota bacterium]
MNGLTKLVIRRRLWVLIPIVVVTAVLGSRIPDLEADPAPERLLASFEQDDGFFDAVEDFESNFGSTDRVMVLVLQADNVMSLENLRYLHKVSRHFRNEPWVERADSLTLLPLPRIRSQSATADEAPTLDDLDEDLFAEDEPGAEAEPEAADPEM